MKIPVGCMQCTIERFEITKCPTIDNINEQDYYVVTCEHGHKSYYYCTNEKFDLLFSMAIQALCDQYYREAVLNFASAIERFYEFSLALMSRVLNVPSEDFDTFYKSVSRHSERELGAYTALYLAILKKPAKILSNSKRTFRNEIVHKGKSPTRDETIRYGEAVYNLIYDDYNFFKKNYPKQIMELNLETQRKTITLSGVKMLLLDYMSFIKDEKFTSIDEMIKTQEKTNSIFL